jgi:hypothetical protein
LTSSPEKVAFAADVIISKADPDWRAKVLDEIERHAHDPIPGMIEFSRRAFERDLAGLLQTHYRQWVAYRGDEQLGFGRSETELYECCLRHGWNPHEFVVRSIEPLTPDAQIVIEAPV